MNYPERKNFSIIRPEKQRYYFIQCDDTGELITGKISGIQKAQRLLRQNVGTAAFLESSKDMTKEEIAKRVKIFGGRLRPKKKPWTLEEARLVASLYDTRGQLYNENVRLYAAAYQKNWLNDICSHMKPSRKKNKFIFGVLNPNAALAKIFDYPSHTEFALDNKRAYNILRSYGVNTVELFDNLENANYLKNTIKKLADETTHRFITV